MKTFYLSMALACILVGPKAQGADKVVPPIDDAAKPLPVLPLKAPETAHPEQTPAGPAQQATPGRHVSPAPESSPEAIATTPPKPAPKATETRIDFQKRMTEIRSEFDAKMRRWEAKAPSVQENVKLAFDKRMREFRKRKVEFERRMEALDDKAKSGWKKMKDDADQSAARLKKSFDSMDDPF